MGAHMLRLHLGDQKFVKFLQRFYREQRGKVATFADVRACRRERERAAVDTFLDDWITRAGAPRLAIEERLGHA